MDTTLVVLAAGMGSRYGGLKQLEPVGPEGEALLDYSIFDALRAGFSRIALVIRPETELHFRRHLSPRLLDGDVLSYAHQTVSLGRDVTIAPPGRQKPWGTGHAVLVTEALIQEPFAVINADDFYGFGAFVTVGQFLRETNGDARPTFALAGFRLGQTLSGAGPVSRGLCQVNGGGWLERIVEVPELSKHGAGGLYTGDDGTEHIVPKDTLVSMNMWGFTPAIYDELSSRFRGFLEAAGKANGETSEFLIPDAVQAMISEGAARVRVLNHSGQWCGLTFPGDRQLVREFIASRVAAGEYPERLWDRV
jgi:hypothetical protein